MVNERYEGEGQEEGEYHFSDDQANYDMETETAKDSAAVAVAPKESVADKLKQHRRVVIGLVVFIILLGIVYKLVTPSSNNPATDFQTAPDAAISAKTTQKSVTQAAPAPVSQTVTTQPAAATTTTIAQPTAVTTVTTQPAVAEPVQQPAQPDAQVAPQQTAPAQPAAITTTTTTAPAPAANLMDRVTTLEQQNSAMMNLIQTQYAQKISDAELQNSQLRTQVQELTSRISNMEVAFQQLTKILQNSRGGAVAGMPNRGMVNAPTASRVSSPKNIYTVQAIIPGRAWLKTDSGDTVTVAEGDVLKGYGRITKIDPYDGIVDIDTGNRIITLAYGANGD